MKFAFAVLALTTFGCSSSPPGSAVEDMSANQNNVHDQSTPLDQTATTCSRNCACNGDGGIVCIGSSSSSPYPASCLPTCDVDVVCDNGARCVFLINEPTATAPVCIPTNFSDNCAGASPQVCDAVIPHCIGSTVLIKPYKSADSRTCGSEVEICPSLCVDESPTEADGAVIDGGIAAHCE